MADDFDYASSSQKGVADDFDYASSSRGGVGMEDRLRHNNSGATSEGNSQGSINSSQTRRAMSSQSKYDELAVFQAAPLVWKGRDGKLHPIEMLDFDREREILSESMVYANKIGAQINVVFETATTDRLGAFLATSDTQALHFSCHGATDFVCFEDGSGGTQFLTPDDLRELVSVRSGELCFVFVSACFSRFTGEAFVKAGVPHVVCCRQDERVMDIAAAEFCRNFYRALSCGKTLRESFLLGKQAVKLSPLVPTDCAKEEMNMFLLLPEDGEHDVPIFYTKPRQRVTPWPSARPSPCGLLPHPPDEFVGREMEMYQVLQSLGWSRLVKLTGPSGVGKCSLAAAVCRYMIDRRRTFPFKEILWLPLGHSLRKDALSVSLRLVFDMLRQENLGTEFRHHSKYEKACGTIMEHFSEAKALFVVDAKDYSVQNMQKLSLFLSDVFRGTRYVKVVLVTRNYVDTSLGSSCVESEVVLNLLGFEASTTLFGMICPFITGRRCPAVCTPRQLSCLLVSEGQQDLKASSKGLSKRTTDIFHLIGGGIPARIRSAAREMKSDEFDKLIEIGKREECIAVFATRVDLEQQLTKLGDELQKAVRAQDFQTAKKIQESHDEVEKLRETLPDLAELSSKVWSLNVLLKHAISQKDFSRACQLQEEIACLESKIQQEEKAQGGLNGTKWKVSGFATRAELESQIRKLGNELEKAAQTGDFRRAREMQRTMLQLEKLRTSLPTSSELTTKIHSTKSDLDAAIKSQNFIEAKSLHETIQQLEEQLSLEEDSQPKCSSPKIPVDKKHSTANKSKRQTCNDQDEICSRASSLIGVDEKSRSKDQSADTFHSPSVTRPDVPQETDAAHVSVSAIAMACRQRFLPNPFSQFVSNAAALSATRARECAMMIVPEMERCASAKALPMSTGEPSADKSVYNGLAGIAYAYLRLGQQPTEAAGDGTSRTKHFRLARDLALTCLKDKEFRQPEPDAPVSFYCGAPGCLAISCVASCLLDEMNSCESLLVELFSYADSALSHVEDELLFGRAGYLFALLYVRSQLMAAGHSKVAQRVAFDTKLRLVSERIIASGRSCAARYEYKSAGWPLMWHCFRSPHGGAAHGLIGILKMLHHCWGLLSLTSQTLVRQTTERLLQCCRQSGSPPVVIGSSKDELVHWCHGSPGLPAMIAAAIAVDDNTSGTLRDAALKAGEDVWRRGVLLKGNGLCHGLAGNAYAFLSLYCVTGDENWIYRARAFASLIHDPWVQHAVKQQPDPQRYVVGVPDSPCSLMEGSAGVMCFLLDLTRPEVASFPGWDF